MPVPNNCRPKARKPARNRVVASAMASPAAPPANESNSPSVSSCWNSRAPNASRARISLCRFTALASIRLATFEQAISRISDTTAISIARNVVTVCRFSGGKRDSFAGISRPLRLSLFSFSARQIGFRLSVSCAKFASACENVTPGFSRPAAESHSSPE